MRVTKMEADTPRHNKRNQQSPTHPHSRPGRRLGISAVTMQDFCCCCHQVHSPFELPMYIVCARPQSACITAVAIEMERRAGIVAVAVVVRDTRSAPVRMRVRARPLRDAFVHWSCISMHVRMYPMSSRPLERCRRESAAASASRITIRERASLPPTLGELVILWPLLFFSLSLSARCIYAICRPQVYSFSSERARV